MLVGVISDIHGNFHALKASVEAMEKKGVEEYLFLGDYVSDTPYPRETMDYLYELNRSHSCSFVRGNREDYMIEQRRVLAGKIKGEHWIANSASGNLLYTYERLTEEDLDFFEEMPITFLFERAGYPAIRCCHGSPENSRELMLLEGENTRQHLDRADADYLLAAHTHQPGMRTVLCNTAQGKVYRSYINSGSCGVAMGDPGYAQSAILRSTEKADGSIVWETEFLKVPYDTAVVVRDIFDRGLYQMGHWFINSIILILLTGINLSNELIQKAAGEKEDADGEVPVWPMIEECYFAKAAEKLGIPEYGDGRIDRGE